MAASAAPPRQYGCTPPLSLRHPTGQDVALTAELEAMMRRANLYETAEGMRRRHEVLEKLEAILEEWASSLIDFPVPGVRHARLFTFGSYKLGIVAPGGDIDSLCVTGSTATRESFFSDCYSMLARHESVTKIQAVPDAYTPIIKFCFDGIEIDLLFARLAMPHLPPNLSKLDDDSLLRNVDERTVRSLNGCRVAADLISLVPHKANFMTALRFIKYWARRRGLYSNAFGYLGGISWALLTGRICQFYPNAAPALLVLKFFAVFSQWDWTKPVQLCPIKEYPSEAGLMGFQVWNPRVNAQDRLHLMPIITPSFPCMNSTYNVTHTTFAAMAEEFRRGYEMCLAVRKRTATWEDVARPLDFFGSADHFLEIQILSDDMMAFRKLKGYIESRMRILIKKLENLDVVNLHLWPETISYVENGLGSAAETDLSSADSASSDSLNSISSSAGTAPPTAIGSIYFALYPTTDQEELHLEPAMADYFPTVITQWNDWDTYQNNVNLRVSYLTRHNLPPYLRKYRQKYLEGVGEAAAAKESDQAARLPDVQMRFAEPPYADPPYAESAYADRPMQTFPQAEPPKI